MQKIIASSALALSLLAAPLALAQPYAGACVSIPAGLSVGSRGSEVSTLQTFLVAQDYPGSGSWMQTGYFGQATAAALRNFQRQRGVAETGMVDSATASAIANAACGAAPGYPAPSYPALTYPTYPSSPYPPYQFNNYYGGAPAITSLSQNTGMPGNAVTIYGVGFDQLSNTVNFGATPLYNIPSGGGTSLTFTVPSSFYSYAFTGTSLQLTVQNSRGTSNAVAFTLYGNPYACGSYPYNTNCGICLTPGTGGYGYNYYGGYNYANPTLYCPPPNTTTPVVNYLAPAAGPVGTSVTVYGSGFSTSGNTVHFGTGIIANLNSSDGRAVSFIVPNTLTGYGSQPVTLSTYQVSVTTSAGYTSNTVPFTVTGLSNGGAPTITSVSGPTSLSVGAQGVWTLYVNTMNNPYLTLSVNWGDRDLYPTAQQMSYNTIQQTNTLTHTYYASGTYTITFTVSNGVGQSNTYTTTVAVSGSAYQWGSSVSIATMAFNPATIVVQRGATVTWTNNDSVAHTVTSDSNYFGSGTLSPGQSFAYTFNTAGTYSYHCAIHPMMTGVVVVQ